MTRVRAIAVQDELHQLLLSAMVLVPQGLLMTSWRDGTFGALRMGARHGVYCLGCCWALMCVLFVVGVMNLVWVATPTGLVLLKKTRPAGTGVARVAGTAMRAVGILLNAAKV